MLEGVGYFGVRSFPPFWSTITDRPPPFLAPAKVSSWSTSLDVLGWTIDTVAVVISLTSAKLLQLSLLLEAWPPARAVASKYELRSLMGKLLHVSEVVRPGIFSFGVSSTSWGCPLLDLGTSCLGIGCGQGAPYAPRLRTPQPGVSR